VTIDAPESAMAVSGHRNSLRSSIAALFLAVARERPTASEIVARAEAPDRPDAHAVAILIGTPAEVDDASKSSRQTVDLARGGLGLALPIAERILVRHGWELAAAGSGTMPPGRGAVILSIPHPSRERCHQE
jgi:hypothetical protein